MSVHLSVAATKSVRCKVSDESCCNPVCPRFVPACSCSKLGEDGYPSVTPDLRIINLGPLDVGMGREKRGRCLGIPVLVCESLFPKRNSVRVFLSLSETTNQGTFPGMDCRVWKEKKKGGRQEGSQKMEGEISEPQHILMFFPVQRGFRKLGS